MMDSIACTDESKETVVRIDSDGNVETGDSSSSESPKANVLLPLGPITPDSIKEIGDVPFDLNSSPLTGPNKPQKTICFDVDTDSSNSSGVFVSTDCGSPQTGTHAVFDPFAPGHEDMMLAPLSKRPTRKAKLGVSRRLDFYSSDALDCGGNGKVSVSDDEMIETVYENLLEIIISMQTEGGVAQLSKAEWDSDDDCKTPPAPRLTGIAETCPYAPLKRAGKSKNIDLGLCRKLQF